MARWMSRSGLIGENMFEKDFVIYWIDTDKETGKRYGMTSTLQAQNFSEAYEKANKLYSEITQVVLQNTYINHEHYF